MKKTSIMVILSSFLVFILLGGTAALADDKVIIENLEDKSVIIEELEDWELDIVNENFGVTTDEPLIIVDEEGLITPLGLDSPTTSHNLITHGQMDFAGSADISPLYTNKYFTGKSSVNIYVKNHSSTKTLKFAVWKSTGFTAVGKQELAPGSSMYWNPTGLDSSGNYFIKFEAPSNFSGYVK